MKKVFVSLILLLCLAFPFSATSCTKGNEEAFYKREDYKFDEFVTLEEAYESGLLTQYDLEKIAAYHNLQVSGLDENIEQKIKVSAAERLNKINSEEILKDPVSYPSGNLKPAAKADDFVIGNYFGEYNGYYFVYMDLYPEDVSLGFRVPEAESQSYWEEIDGANIYHYGTLDIYACKADEANDVMSFYRLADAYENGVIDKVELNEIVSLNNMRTIGVTDNDVVWRAMRESAVSSLQKAGLDIELNDLSREHWYDWSYYGEYCGCYAVRMNLYPERLFGKSPSAGETKVGGIEFSDLRDVVVYKPSALSSGELISVAEAYESGIISKEDLMGIAEKNNFQTVLGEDARSALQKAQKKLGDTFGFPYYYGKFGDAFAYEIVYYDDVIGKYSRVHGPCLINADGALVNESLDEYPEIEYSHNMQCGYDWRESKNFRDETVRSLRKEGIKAYSEDINFKFYCGVFGGHRVLSMDLNYKPRKWGTYDNDCVWQEIDGVKFYCKDLSELRVEIL